MATVKGREEGLYSAVSPRRPTTTGAVVAATEGGTPSDPHTVPRTSSPVGPPQDVVVAQSYTPRYVGGVHGRYGVSYIGGGQSAGRPDPGRWFSIWGAARRPQQRRGTCFVTAVIAFLSFEYITYVATILSSVLDAERKWPGVIYIVFFHLCFLLLLTAFVNYVKIAVFHNITYRENGMSLRATSITDPGTVPGNWGFYMGDDCKRRRYCKVCHLWKPDRTHHCSACGRCVLNMDHHCPWVNNCIGFENRKYFIQLLCYALICVLCVAVHGTYFLLNRGSDLFPPQTAEPNDDLLQYIKDVGAFASVVIMLLLAVLLGIPLIPFTKFHLTMIARNSSTIENMDVLNRTRGRYDLGTLRNLEQVLGANIWLWWVPCHTPGSRPVGDGVRWRQQYWNAVEAADH